PLAQFVEMAAFQNVWIRPEPLRRPRHMPFDKSQGLSTKQEPAKFLRSDSFREPARSVWQIRAPKRLGSPSAESARSATVSSEGSRAMPAARARVRRDAPTSDRVAALDALRVVSMAAVVALHASAAYMTVRIPGLIWLVHEPAGSEFVQQFAWWSYGATMPPFFALARYAGGAVG